MKNIKIATVCSVGLFSNLLPAHWGPMGDIIPLKRLISNAESSLKKNPKNAETLYVLGRAHSMGYATGREDYAASTKNGKFYFFPDDPIRLERDKGKAISKESIDHLGRSINYYWRSLEQVKKSPPQKWSPEVAAGLGLAWMLEQAAPLISKLDKSKLPPKVIDSTTCQRLALKLYQSTYKLTIVSDLAAGERLMNLGDRYIAEEAGEGILRLIADPKVGSLSGKEKDEITRNVNDLGHRSGAITPIIFSLNRQANLRALPTENRRSRFDLVGDGIPREYGWVSADAAFLAWDPRGTGRITSGRQLFGSGTFWMEFGTGYRALAALDDNHDGWLTGNELRGIVVWHDRNQNGISDPGEVVSLKSLGIVAIRVRPDTSINGMQTATRGLIYTNGTTAPTLDWVTKGKMLTPR